MACEFITPNGTTHGGMRHRPTARSSASWRSRFRGLPHTLLAVLALAWFCTAFAQESAAHPVTIQIPTYNGIRIVDANGDVTASANVQFDYRADPVGYLTAAKGSEPLTPTDAASFADILVLANGKGWKVYVQATEMTSTGRGRGLHLEDIRVRRGVASLLNVATGLVRPSWSLSVDPQEIAAGLLPTMGWKSLGFNGSDYAVAVQGDEDPGEYFTRVTYSLVNP